MDLTLFALFGDVIIGMTVESEPSQIMRESKVLKSIIGNKTMRRVFNNSRKR